MNYYNGKRWNLEWTIFFQPKEGNVIAVILV